MVMSESDRMRTSFSGGAETPELEDYRPISPLVVGACVTALVSFVAVVHPVLWVVPVVAAALSIGAIVRVSAPQSRYSGRPAAVIALGIAMLSGTYAPARTLSYERALGTRAQEKTEAWISLIQKGRLQEAHQFTKDLGDRFQGPGSLASHYDRVPPDSSSAGGEGEIDEMQLMGPPPGEELNQFAENSAIVKLLEFGEQTEIELLRNVEIHESLGDATITQRYRARGVHEGRPQSIEFLIRATRREGEKRAHWKVGNIELVE